MGAPLQQGTPRKPLSSRDEGRAPFPNLPWKIYFGPTQRQKRAALHTTGGRKWLDTQVRVLGPFHPSLRRCTWPTSRAGMILLQGGTAEYPKMVVA